MNKTTAHAQVPPATPPYLKNLVHVNRGGEDYIPKGTILQIVTLVKSDTKISPLRADADGFLYPPEDSSCVLYDLAMSAKVHKVHVTEDLMVKDWPTEDLAGLHAHPLLVLREVSYKEQLAQVVALGAEKARASYRTAAQAVGLKARTPRTTPPAYLTSAVREGANGVRYIPKGSVFQLATIMATVDRHISVIVDVPVSEWPATIEEMKTHPSVVVRDVGLLEKLVAEKAKETPPAPPSI